MAALDAAAVELAKSFTQEEIPIKLRCATCNRFAFDSVKLPCCDQSICGICATGLPEQCPICDHSPLAAEECRANKALRMTIKAYLKNEEKKRSKNTTTSVVSPVVDATLSGPPAQIASTEAVSKEVPTNDEEKLPENGSTSVPAQAFPPEQEMSTHETTSDSLPATTNGTEPHEAVAAEMEQEEEEEEDEDDVVVTTERPPNSKEHEVDANEDNGDGERYQVEQQQVERQSQQQNSGFDQDQQSFNSMNFGGMNGFNPMMAMSNGMGMPNLMGMPNMMGMPGMNMDPSMMFNGAFGGMDMSMMGMGMGMGMNGFGGMPGMAMNGAGFFPGQGGYNNSNFGNHMHQNFRNDRGFGGRPYGRGGYSRGRGYNNFSRGRGGPGYHVQNYSQNHQAYVNQRNYNDQSEGAQDNEQQPGRRGSPDYGPQKPRDVTVNELGSGQKASDKDEAGDRATIDASSGSGVDVPATNNSAGTESAPVTEEQASGELIHDDAAHSRDLVHSGQHGGAAAEDQDRNPVEHFRDDQEDGLTKPDTANNHDGACLDNRAMGRAGFHGGRGGHGGQVGHHASTEATELTPVAAPPVNAPTGPKAMREGKPNTGWYSRPQQTQPPPGPAKPVEEERLRHDDRHDHARSTSRSRSRSRSRHGSHKHRHRSYEDDDSESDEAYQRRKDRERRKRKEREREREREREEDDMSSRKERSRGNSREDESSKRRHRDKYDDHKSSRSRRERSRDRRKHRHRSRSRSPDRDTETNGGGGDDARYHKHRGDGKYDEYESSSRKDRSSRKHSRKDEDGYEDKERSSRHSRSSRKHEDLPSVVDSQPPDDFKIKGSKSGSINPAGMPPPQSRRRGDRRSSLASTPTTPATPTGPSDPYAEERERRHAERVLKEQQRRQSSSSLGKRTTRDDDSTLDGLESAPKGPRLDSSKYSRSTQARKDRRTMSVKYEGEVGEDYDDRYRKRY